MKTTEVAAYWEANAATWTRHAREGHDFYRDLHNTPAFLAILPPVAGLAGLDVGCGEGSNTRKLAERGATMKGIDIAPTFISHAQQAEAMEPLGIGYKVGDGAALPFPAATFDFVTAFMSLMDMPDQGAALKEAHRVLRPGGFLQFSILHPCFVPPHRKVLREADRTVRAVEVGGYFDAIDGRIDTWWFSSVPPEERAKVPPFRIPRFHRPIGAWVDMIVEAGLVIEKMAEPRATLEEATAEPELADTRVVPLFLHVRARKPSVARSD
jgi:SAM-dependent methyltransferase